MNIIGIIAAMQEEMQEIKNIMTGIQEKNIYELTFIEGTIKFSELKSCLYKFLHIIVK